MRKQNTGSIFAFALLSVLLMACGGSDPVDVSGGIVGTVYDSNNNPLSGEYKSSIMPEYEWVFENGVFISTTADS